MNRLMTQLDDRDELEIFFAKPRYGQPAPISNNRPAVWDLVMQDMKARNEFGKEKYGTPLQAFNGRDALKDAYEEALDLCVYLRTAIEERDNPRNVYE